MDPLAMASSLDTSVPVSTDDVMGFDNYCIVCDRLIVPPKAPEVKQKKKAGGTITVKNADGTKTTRNANGKVTRPAIRRNPSSMNRLAAVAANNNVAKLLPLTRSKTTENASAASTEEPSPPPRTTPPSTPFHSSIYCSRECAQTDAGRSNEAYKDIARTLSYDFSLPHPPFASDGYHGISVGDRFNAHGPPSPIFISGSDTDSSVAGPDGPACSAPQTLGYFRMSREGPDEAWNEVQRQRRSSMHPIIRPGSLARPPSHLGNGHKGVGDLSTDSLSSLWHNTTTEAELYLARSPSNPGRSREGFNRRSMSSSSERSAAPVRPVARSNLSQTSLTASPPTQAVPIPPEFGSAPNHTVNLLQSYAAAFPVRDPSGTSQSQKGFVFPGSSVEARRPSHGAHSLSYGTPMTNLSRPVNGTIRAKSRQETWDSFGKTEMEARAKAAQPHADGAGCTPKQSLEMENGRWKVRYVSADLASSLDQRPGTIRQRSRSRSSGRSVTSHTGSNESDAAASGITIPSRQTLSTSYNSHHTANGRTPQQGPMAPPRSIPLNRASTTAPTTSPRPASSVPSRTQSHIPIPTLPDLAAMRIGAPTPLVGLSHDNASVPKSGFNWTEHEKKGGKTYELPKGLKIDRSKAGLFYFN